MINDRYDVSLYAIFNMYRNCMIESFSIKWIKFKNSLINVNTTRSNGTSTVVKLREVLLCNVISNG